jgi:hypothetical protein
MSLEDNTTLETISKRSRTKSIIVGIVVLIAICAIGAFFISKRYLQYDLYGSGGGYSITEVVLTDEIDIDGKPIGSKSTFTPSDTIFGWVHTEGAEGIVGFRWFHDSDMIFEHFGKTQANQIITYIESNNNVILPEGNYRLEITTGGTPLEVIEFTVSQDKPELSTIQPTPIGHQKLETSPFVEVPFAFDEIWTIDGEDWQINEVKIVLLSETPIIAVVAIVEENPAELTENQLRPITQPIALYAIQNVYLETAKSLEIDGEILEYEELFITLFNPELGAGNRTPFVIDQLEELVEQ